jgi:alkylation response protein AidB-like acyl-CoA dehydrogenase
MDFSFTSEQQQLRDNLSRLLQQRYGFEARGEIVNSGIGWSPDVWRDFIDMGLLALPFAESAGGLGGSPVDLVAVAELLGEHLVVEPYLSVVTAGSLLAATENETARAWLGRLVAGEATAALAHEEAHGTFDVAEIETAARSHDGRLALDGAKSLVIGGSVDLLLVSARLDGRTALFAVPPSAQGVSADRYTTIDGKRAANLTFDDVALTVDHLLLADASVILASALDQSVLASAAEAVGVMGVLLRTTAEYASVRKQFGQPIARFQAVAHRLADMKLAYVKARATLLYTAALAEADRATSRDFSILKAQVGRLGRMIGEAAIQTHGGVGMTDDIPVGHYVKRLLAIDAMHGSAEYHLRLIGA